MQLLDKVKSNVNACEIQLIFDGIMKPSIIEGWQPFYNSTYTGTLEKTYVTIASINFTEEISESTSGVIAKQKVLFSFPITDQFRAHRIELIMNIKFILVKLNNGQTISVGRNDFNQNTKPKIKIATNAQTCEVSFEVQSIAPAGFVSSITDFGLPVSIPLTF